METLTIQDHFSSQDSARDGRGRKGYLRAPVKAGDDPGGLACKRPIDFGKLSAYTDAVIRTFRSKALAELWAKGRTAKIDAKLHKRILVRLDRMPAATAAEQMDIPGFDFHALKGFATTRYTVPRRNGPWCITFEFDAADAVSVDFEQYH